MGRRLKRRGYVAPLVLVLGASLATSILAISTLLRLDDLPELQNFVQRPTLIENGESLNGRGVAIQSPPPVTIAVVGDIMLDREVAGRMRRSGNPVYAFERLPKDWFHQFDFAVGNLEGPVTDRRRSPEKSIDFLFDPSVLAVLKTQGFDGFSQANNHAFDQGRAGYDDSMRRLGEAGFLAFGEQVRDGEEALAFASIRNKVVAFLGFNTTDNPLDKEAAALALEQAKLHAHMVIVMTHWGPEYRNTPHPSDIEDAHWLIDHGADMVIGGHPHWEQGFSVYNEKLIAWSLGNFIFDQDWSQKTREGTVLTLTLAEDRLEAAIHPVYINQSRPGFVDGQEKQRRLDALAEVSDEVLREQVRNGKLILHK